MTENNGPDIQGFEGDGNVYAQLTRSQWTACGEQQVEAATADVPHIAKFDALVAVYRRWFPEGFPDLGNGSRCNGGKRTTKDLRDQAAPSV